MDHTQEDDPDNKLTIFTENLKKLCLKYGNDRDGVSVKLWNRAHAMVFYVEGNDEQPGFFKTRHSDIVWKLNGKNTKNQQLSIARIL